MKLTALCFSLLALTACQPEFYDASLSTNSDSIIGGSLAGPNDPVSKSTVILLSVDLKTGMATSGCSANILTKKILLTAAHCVLDEKSKALGPERLVVYFGNIGKKGLEQHRMAGVKTVKIHPRLRQDSYNTQFDLALLQLTSDIPSDMAPAELYDGQLTEGLRVIVAGFGKETVKYGPATEMPLKVYNDFKVLALGSSSSQLTLKGPPKLGSFKGDSGGPGYVKVDGKLKLWGVFSMFFWLPEKSGITGQARYEDLSYSRTWIKETIANMRAKGLSL